MFARLLLLVFSIGVLALPAGPARAGDPLEDRDGTESWDTFAGAARKREAAERRRKVILERVLLEW